MPRKLRDSVVVITGASSGIGRAAALDFARRGAAVVLAARREAPLRELAAECQELGAQALAVPTDVTDEGAVRALARRAVESFGRLDVWVNNAAVTLFGSLEEARPEDYRRVIETNLFGYIHGARAALPCFREQGGGVLINNSSVAGRVPELYTSAYVTAKFGILGFSDCLRLEVADSGIHVCNVLPASIDTPLYQHGANYTGWVVKPLSPIIDAEDVARAIVDLAEHPRRDVVVGNAGRMLLLVHRLWPALAEQLLARKVRTERFVSVPAAPTSGNLYEPMPQWTGVSGGWRRPSPARVPRVAALGLAALLPALMALLLLRPGPQSRR